MSTLRIAIVGAGFMGLLHARVVADSDRATVAAIIDPDVAGGRAAAEAFGVPHFADAGEALAADAADAYIVAAPDRLHEDVTCALLAAGKPVLLEKPMAHTLTAAKAIARAAEKSGARLLVAHILRFDPRYAAAAKAVREGRIGTPIHASSGRLTNREVGQRMNGRSSVCFYLGIHDVDMLQWITGSNVRTVYSRTVSTLMPSLGVASEDAIFTTVEMENGMAGQLHSGWTLPESVPTGIWARTEVIGTEGMIDLDVRDHGLRILSRGQWSLPDGLHWPETHGHITGDLYEEVRHFIGAVLDDRPFVMPVEDALRAVAVNDAILASVASGQRETVADWRI
ncbi:Gfo/Idh/MocA family protein [Ensifer soli]|uniref:Gfo/Idh/MocA family protein n=1 Tax=Ciceribacter sp. sgz301302 TaxID=3342379 RepID=UPI0035B7F191